MSVNFSSSPFYLYWKSGIRFIVESDDDEPLMSGNGMVSMEISDGDLMVAWGALIAEWQAKLQNTGSNGVEGSGTPRPPIPTTSVALNTGPDIDRFGILFKRRIRMLVQRGIPDALRAETWQMLAGHQDMDQGLCEVYRILMTRVGPNFLSSYIGVSAFVVL